MHRMNELKYTYRVQWLVFAGSAILFLLLAGAWIGEFRGKEWREYQSSYKKILVQQSDSLGGALKSSMERGIFQIELTQFNRIDRCISCHNGLENQQMADVSQPHALHPGSFLSDHPVGKYGCTICHGGQGRALNKVEAFGQLPETYWPYPLLEQPYIQSSCGKCHLSIFNSDKIEEPEEMAGMDIFRRGKIIFSREGCLGCHQARGVGGIIGPDLTQQGEKTKHEYSFQSIKGEQTVSNWLKEHFRDPEMVSPGSQMLRINLEEEELEALATFIMGLSKPEIPFEYFTLATLNEFKGIRDPMDGESGYAYLCSACHGKKGEGKNYNEYKTGVPAIGNRDFIRVASEEFIRFTLEKGRSKRQMGTWEPKVSGLEPAELDEMVRRLKSGFERSPDERVLHQSRNISEGQRHFTTYCAACHGSEGTGDVAIALNQEESIKRANDTFLLQTILKGRKNTSMPGWSHLDDKVLGELLAYLRSWEGAGLASQQMVLPEGDLDAGGLRYHYLCSRCHGEFGEGETGPAIINRDFLEAAGNRFLYETIARGRVHTAMFGWSSDVYNQEKLGPGEISNIIGFMRQSARGELSYVYPGSNPGNSDAGRLLFEQRCAECHGNSGEGKKAPALNNQEFLSAASNGYLLATITIGRSGTDMPSWGYGTYEYPVLTGKERNDLVAFLRSHQRIRIKY